MLKHLSITNYAIIEALELDFNKGFTVITGETGAGKSILLGALSLILGQRADTSVLNNKDKKCIVEGEFQFKDNLFKSFFSEHDLDFESSTLIRREINSKGKSRAFVNDTPVNLNIIKELAQHLLDIHSQHETLQMKESLFQLDVIDTFADALQLRNEFKVVYSQFQEEEEALNQLKSLSLQANSDLDYLKFQVNEIEELQLKSNEKEEIEDELSIINGAEEIKQVLQSATHTLDESEQNIILQLRDIVRRFSDIAELSEHYKTLHERLNSLLIEMEDVTREIVLSNDDFSFDPERLTYLNDRLNKIYTIEQKHQVSSTTEIIALFESMQQRLADIGNYDERLADKQAKVDQLKDKALKAAVQLSEKRSTAFADLETNIIESLAELGMPEATFKIGHQRMDAMNSLGVDVVQFLFSANKGFEPKEIGKVASGGELSRLMLTIKSILVKNKDLATLIFDEIDTGVSGDIADKMAQIMSNMSKDTQIIAITHLPQVAAKGDQHYKIYKETLDDKTLTSIQVIEKDDRIEELAKMLSGKELTEEAKKNAAVLLSK